MRGITRLVAGTVVAAALYGAAAPASAITNGDCNGAVDTGCSYCSYEGSDYASPPSYCDKHTDGYKTVLCALWVDNGCVVG